MINTNVFRDGKSTRILFNIMYSGKRTITLEKCYSSDSNIACEKKVERRK